MSRPSRRPKEAHLDSKGEPLVATLLKVKMKLIEVEREELTWEPVLVAHKLLDDHATKLLRWHACLRGEPTEKGHPQKVSKDQTSHEEY